MIKRPHVDRFLRTVRRSLARTSNSHSPVLFSPRFGAAPQVSKWYHVIIFTASVRQYGDPVINMLDPTGLVKERLFRSSCVNQRGNFVKDLAVLNRDLSQVIIVDNSPVAYTFNPRTHTRPFCSLFLSFSFSLSLSLSLSL